MITYMVPYKNCLKVRKQITLNFLEEMDKILKNNLGLECFISDYGSDDGIKELSTSYRSTYLYTEPNKDNYLNTSKCLNNAIVHSNNDLIAPLGIDFRISQYTVERTIDLFRLLGTVIFRPQLTILNEKGKASAIENTPYVLKKSCVMLAHGWDERMKEWGKEEDDLISRIHYKQKVIQVSILGFGYEHAWHSREWAHENDGLQENGFNYKIALENGENNAKNLVNSYW